MSFANSAKLEALNSEIGGSCCKAAFLCGVLKSGGSLNIRHGVKNFEVVTEFEKLCEIIQDITKQLYDTNIQIVKLDEEGLKQAKFKMVFDDQLTTKLMQDYKIIDYGEDGLNHDINPSIIDEDCCKRAYIKAVFIMCATSNIVIKKYDNKLKSASGYHLEFVFSYEDYARSFMQLLDYFEIKNKLTFRKSQPIVYIKEYQLICDALALVGANKCVLNLQNEVAIREVRNNVNRQTNCFNANLNKTVNASVKQLEAIKVIRDKIGLENLSAPLYELCLLRLANPEESLENLTKLYSEEITKSGINHRFNKLQKIADKLLGK